MKLLDEEYFKGKLWAINTVAISSNETTTTRPYKIIDILKQIAADAREEQAGRDRGAVDDLIKKKYAGMFCDPFYPLTDIEVYAALDKAAKGE